MLVLLLFIIHTYKTFTPLRKLNKSYFLKLSAIVFYKICLILHFEYNIKRHILVNTFRLNLDAPKFKMCRKLFALKQQE